jgi:Fasciclin domain
MAKLLSFLAFVWVPAVATSSAIMTLPDNSLFHNNQLEEKSMFENLNSVPVLTTFNAAIHRAQLPEVLPGPGPYTVIMPWNMVFENLDQEMWEKLLTDSQWILHLRVRYFRYSFFLVVGVSLCRNDLLTRNLI